MALILGGSGKGEDYAPLAAVMDAVVHVVTIGQEGPAIAEVLAGRVPLSAAVDMPTAVRQAADELEAALRRDGLPAGDVMLSPACASFDMFTGYRQRGEKFMAAALAVGAQAVDLHE